MDKYKEEVRGTIEGYYIKRKSKDYWAILIKPLGETQLIELEYWSTYKKAKFELNYFRSTNHIRPYFKIQYLNELETIVSRYSKNENFNKRF